MGGGGGGRWAGGGGRGGGRWAGGGYGYGGRHHFRHRGRGFGYGFAYGAAPYIPYYNDDYYEDEPIYEVAPQSGADEYCARRFRSYDPRSGTYLGYDGRRHPCP
jgi:hypothetical protein